MNQPDDEDDEVGNGLSIIALMMGKLEMANFLVDGVEASVSSRRRSETAGKEIPQCGSAAGHQSLSSWSPFSNIVVVVVVANSLSSHYDDFFSVCFVRDHPTGRTTAITGTLLCAATGRFVFPALPAGSHRAVLLRPPG
ncbi:hypothetical protein RP20_CCG012367 [Aedes albopictus]|nr:hypothetical protein RP20_CCG012367 [Aedes albopictus]